MTKSTPSIQSRATARTALHATSARIARLKRPRVRTHNRDGSGPTTGTPGQGRIPVAQPGSASHAMIEWTFGSTGCSRIRRRIRRWRCARSRAGDMATGGEDVSCSSIRRTWPASRSHRVPERGLVCHQGQCLSGPMLTECFAATRYPAAHTATGPAAALGLQDATVPR